MLWMLHMKTPEQLIASFASLISTDNYHPDDLLTDLCCPECGDRDSLSIVMSSWFELHPDGTGDNEDTEWDDESGCKCRSCNHGGKVKDFRFTGLDELIERGIEAELK